MSMFLQALIPRVALFKWRKGFHLSISNVVDIPDPYLYNTATIN